MGIARSLSVTALMLVGSVLPLLATECSNSNTGASPTGGIADAGSLNFAGTFVSLLPLQPASAWTQNPGTINPVCAPPNPTETTWDDLASTSGVELATAASQSANCCTCAARSRAFPTATTPVAGTRLIGEIQMTRGANDQYSEPSFRVTFKLAGALVGAKLFAPESRPNDNCAGSSELPAQIVNGLFNVDISTFATQAVAFDEVDVDLNGYGCLGGTTDTRLVTLAIATPATDGGTNPAATATPTATGTSTSPPSGPTSAGFFPATCGGAGSNIARIESGACPNGVDLSTKKTVTCIIEPCPTPNTCTTTTGTLTVDGDRARADCSALMNVCPMSYQMTINDRIPCK